MGQEKTAADTHLLSIIIPTYNSAAYIDSCLQSITTQTDLSSVEVICIDGGSTDETVEKIKEHAKSQSEIKYISEKDDGIYDAMNKGIDLAKGQWVYFLGSDDTLWAKDTLAQAKKHLKTDLDVVYGNVDVDSQIPGYMYDGEFTNEKIVTKNIGHQAIFYKRDVIKRLGKYNTNYHLLADWDLNLKWFNDPELHKQYIDMPVAKFAPGGRSQTNTDKQFEKDFLTLLDRYGYT
jgi:glycosyltransferase involved in cell wall biosynthesis